MENSQENILNHVKFLSDANRAKRKTALENINFYILNADLDSDALTSLFTDHLLQSLLKSFFDSVEKCRELSINTVTECVLRLSNIENIISLIIPVLVKRLGQIEISEPSEEIRLQLVNLLLQIVLKSHKNFAPYLDEFVRICILTLGDPFSEVRRISCDAISNVARNIPELFHLQADSLIKPLLLTLTHNHSKIRMTTVYTIGTVMQYSNGKSVGDVISHLAQRLFDSSPSVRIAVIKVVGGWLLDLPDRYSYHPKLIPLLLTGFSDEMQEIREESEAFWVDIGFKYELENEKNLKDKQDFHKPDPSHYPALISRPNLGCRVLVYEHFSKILPALVGDLGDWVEDTKIKAAQLLYFLMINEEDNVTQHLNKVLQGIVKASNDENKLVVEWIMKSAELIGYFVNPDIWFEMFIQLMKLVPPKGPIAILSFIISGTKREFLRPYLNKIVTFLSDPGISQIGDSDLQLLVLTCIENMLIVSQQDCSEVRQEIFLILLFIVGLHRKEYIRNKANILIGELAEVNLLSRENLIKDCVCMVIQYLRNSSFDNWTQYSTPVHLLNAFVIEAGPELLPHMVVLCEIFESNLKPSKSADLRLLFFTMLSNMISFIPKDDSSNDVILKCIVRNMIFPNCVWSAGRTAEVVRKIALTSFLHLLHENHLSDKELVELSSEIITLMKSLLDDENAGTRLISCQVMILIFDSISENTINETLIYNSYPELLKRMDDNSDEIRIAAADMFKSYLCYLLRCQYNVNMYRSHLGEMYKGLIIHLDDTNAVIQQKVYEALNSSCHLQPQVLSDLLEAEKFKHRSTYFCDKLIQNIRQLSINQI